MPVDVDRWRNEARQCRCSSKIHSSSTTHFCSSRRGSSAQDSRLVLKLRAQIMTPGKGRKRRKKEQNRLAGPTSKTIVATHAGPTRAAATRRRAAFLIVALCVDDALRLGPALPTIFSLFSSLCPVSSLAHTAVSQGVSIPGAYFDPDPRRSSSTSCGGHAKYHPLLLYSLLDL
jgi:hypothetical protein